MTPNSNALPAQARPKRTNNNNNASAAPRFTLSLPSSAASSRNSSPAPGVSRQNGGALKQGLSSELPDGFDETPGRLPVDVYDAMLPRWRAYLRSKVVQRVESESKVIGRMQECIRTPFWDAYFVYTSSLGTHTFFMTAIPALFFFGYDDLGRSLILVLASGVYITSVIKDLVCSPRPLSPPVTRLTIGTHHLEYGFPSTHSTNSVSIAFFLFALIHRLAYPSCPSSPTDFSIAIQPVLSPEMFMIFTCILCIYSFSIVFGRLYTAMHSFTDCAMGVFLGTLIWWAETSWTGISVRLLPPSTSFFHPISVLSYIFRLLNIGTFIPSSSEHPAGILVHVGSGLGLGSTVNTWVQNGGWEVPLTLIPLCLLAVNQHPQPVDDCPCFEDAIAFGSVVLGILVGRWGTSRLGISPRAVIMPGSGWVSTPDGAWGQVPRNWNDVLLWWSFAVLKMVFGIVAIFAWRLAAKNALRLMLPPTYRLLARAFRLPKRRFYTPATEYESVPSDFSKEGGVLHTIPSVIDLPSAGVMAGDDWGHMKEGGNGTAVTKGRGRNVKMRLSSSVDKEKAGTMLKNDHNDRKENLKEDKEGEPIKHYDADVLTKLVVYSGIAVLATELLPALYNYLGWGVQSWPP